MTDVSKDALLRARAIEIAQRLDDALLGATPPQTAADHELTALLEGAADTLRALSRAAPEPLSRPNEDDRVYAARVSRRVATAARRELDIWESRVVTTLHERIAAQDELATALRDYDIAMTYPFTRMVLEWEGAGASGGPDGNSGSSEESAGVALHQRSRGPGPERAPSSPAGEPASPSVAPVLHDYVQGEGDPYYCAVCGKHAIVHHDKTIAEYKARSPERP